MTRDEALQIAAQAWCDPTTSDRVMDTALAHVFADALIAIEERARRDWESVTFLARAERDEARRERDALRAVLREMTEWFWGVKTEDAVESYERVGQEFYEDTGMMRPGKSYPVEMYPPDDEVRRSTWDAWVKKKRDALEAKARAAIAKAGVDP